MYIPNDKGLRVEPPEKDKPFYNLRPWNFCSYCGCTMKWIYYYSSFDRATGKQEQAWRWCCSKSYIHYGMHDENAEYTYSNV